jgi:hypothetical protein
MMTKPFPDRLPLVVGVTGHRDLREQDVPLLEREVAAIIARLRRDYLHKDAETPLIILSSLAEGADRLVARVGLAHGCHLVAPLPLPVEEYRRDFEPGLVAGNIAEFDAQYAQAITAPVMPFTPGNSLEAARADSDKRAEQYRAVGLFIAQRCDVLLALWDGRDENMSPGGTAEVVAFKRHGIPMAASGSARARLDASEIGPVIHVVTPRKKSDDATLKVSVGVWGKKYVEKFRRQSRRHPPSEHWVPATVVEQEVDAWTAFDTLAGLTRRFNREAAALVTTAEGKKLRQTSLDYLFGNWSKERPEDSNAARAGAEKIAPQWCALYGIADALAQQRQATFRFDWFGLIVVGLVALICFEIESHLLYDWHDSYWFLLGYSVLFFIGFLWFSWARWRQHQERFLDYRALAESLRVAVYWKLVGVAGPKTETGLHSIADAYPIKQTSELAWVKLCLRTLELLDPPEMPAAGERPLAADAYGWARNLWVGGQLDFFFRRGRDHNETAERRERISAILVVVSIATAFMLFWSAYLNWPFPTHDRWDHRLIVFLMGAMPGCAAAVVGYTEQLALKAQARQYDRMRMLFERAYQLLPDSLADTSPAQARALYGELGCEAMKENAEWVAIYRQRPIRPPQG